MPPMTLLPWLLACLLLLAGCAIEDSNLAAEGKRRFVGMQEVDLEACLGAPDQHGSFPNTDILTYYATSTSSTNYSLPIVGGFGVANGAYCHVTFRLDGGVVTHVIYSGEKNATLAPNAYCAPIMRSCLAELNAKPTMPARAAR